MDGPLHEQLREARVARGLTQSDLAALLGENVHWVSKRETGETRLAHEDVVRLASALDLTDEAVLRFYGRAGAA